MTIEIQNPQIERGVRDQIQRGQFRDLDDLLEKALDALQQKEIAISERPSQSPAGRKSLVELFAESPLKGLDLDVSRNRSGARPLDLS